MNSQTRARLAVILGILLFLGGTFWAVRAIKGKTKSISPAVQELYARQSALRNSKDLSKEQRDEERKKMGEEMKKLTDEQKRQLGELYGEARFKRECERAERLFSLPRDQWEAQIQKDMEEFRSRRGGGGPGGGGPGGTNPDRPRGGPGGDSAGKDGKEGGPPGGGDPQAANNRFKAMLDSTTPEQRNQIENYRQMMRAQRIQQQQQQPAQPAAK